MYNRCVYLFYNLHLYILKICYTSATMLASNLFIFSSIKILIQKLVCSSWIFCCAVLNLIILLNRCHDITGIALAVRSFYRIKPMLWQANVACETVITFVDVLIWVQADVVATYQFSSSVYVLGDSVESWLSRRFRPYSGWGIRHFWSELSDLIPSDQKKAFFEISELSYLIWRKSKIGQLSHKNLTKSVNFNNFY